MQGGDQGAHAFSFWSHSEQISVGTGTVKEQFCIRLFICEQPVRCYVAFPISGEIAAQIVLPVLCR